MIGVFMVALGVLGCQEKEVAEASEFTGNEAAYPLQQASVYNIQGSVTFKERVDGSTLITVALSGTEGSVEHPVHLHLGNTTVKDAEVAALLTPVSGKSGIGQTLLYRLADETVITYQQLRKLDACIKVHRAADGPDRDLILSAGNIGSAWVDTTTGRAGIATCGSLE
jgi:hypothetical protein